MEFLYLYSDGDENQEPTVYPSFAFGKKNSIKPKNGIGEDFSDAVLFLYDYFMISNPLTEDKSASAFLHSPKEEAYIFAPVLAVIVTEERFSHL